MKHVRRLLVSLSLLIVVGCSDPAAPKIPSPDPDPRTPTRQPSRGLEGAQGLATVELPTSVV
jgi:hypothetical protein